MNFIIYILILFPLFLIFFNNYNNRKIILKRVIKKNKLKDGSIRMFSIVKNYIGKDCIINIVTSATQIIGVIKEVEGNFLIIEENNYSQAVNLDYVVSIKEFPKNKNGKRKNFV